MKQIQADLWETTMENPLPGLFTHAYLFSRDGGNVLFYNTGHRHEIAEMAELGGVAYQFLSHKDELGDTLKLIQQRFGAKLGGHVQERAAFSRILEPDILFDKREILLGDIDVIPTPGHTPGSTCFLVQTSQDKRYLFTGDTLVLSKDGKWESGFMAGSSEREPLIESLKLLQQLKPDIVLCSGCGGGSGFQEMNPDAWSGHVAHALAELFDE